MPLLLLLFLSVLSSNAQNVKPLSIAELLESVERNFPLLAAAREERNIAAGAATAAQGEFDLKLKALLETDQVGFYRNETAKAFVEQNTTVLGATVYGGYRIGRGSYGPYDEKALTLSGGEWSGGIRLPLQKDRSIDRRRADLQITNLGKEAAEFSVAKERLKIYKSALKQYWDWIAAGRQLTVAKALLLFAQQRNQQIEDQVKLGQLAPIEFTDNQRAILQRQSALVAAERYLQSTSIELSLYLRDDAGEPYQPAAIRLLARFPDAAPLPAEQEQQDLERAASGRPEIQAQLRKRQQQAVETKLAANQVQPQLDLYFNYARDTGVGKTSRKGSEIEAGLQFELPVQRRKAQGKQTQALAKLSQLDAELRFTRDRVQLDVQDAASAVRAAYNSIGIIGAELQAARQLEDAERARFDLGDSSQFFVNQRELATADAAFREIKALADYHKALVEYDASTSRLSDRSTRVE